MTQKISFRDIVKLSTYLDKQLSRSEQSRLEARLSVQPELQAILLELRQARAIMKHTPRQSVPRNFTLTPKMVGMRPPLPRSVPVFRLASLTAAILLFISFTFNFLTPFASAPNLAAAPQLSGSGGGCGNDNPADCGDVAMESIPYGFGGGPPETATPEEPMALSVPADAMTATPQATPQATSVAGLRTIEQPTQDSYNVAPDLPSPGTIPSEKSQSQIKPLLDPFQIALVLLIFVFGIIALLIRQLNIKRWQKRL